MKFSLAVCIGGRGLLFIHSTDRIHVTVLCIKTLTLTSTQIGDYGKNYRVAYQKDGSEA